MHDNSHIYIFKYYCNNNDQKDLAVTLYNAYFDKYWYDSVHQPCNPASPAGTDE